MTQASRRPLSYFSTPSRGDALIKACTASLLSTAGGLQEHASKIAARSWGKDSDPAILLRAASSPSSTTTAGGDMLMMSAVQDFLGNLAPASAGSGSTEELTLSGGPACVAYD
jgi:hypothetical protein